MKSTLLIAKLFLHTTLYIALFFRMYFLKWNFFWIKKKTCHLERLYESTTTEAVSSLPLQGFLESELHRGLRQDAWDPGVMLLCYSLDWRVETSEASGLALISDT